MTNYTNGSHLAPYDSNPYSTGRPSTMDEITTRPSIIQKNQDEENEKKFINSEVSSNVDTKKSLPTPPPEASVKPVYASHANPSSQLGAFVDVKFVKPMVQDA